MTNYNYLKIDFYGQFNSDTIHKFTYPEPYNPMGGASQVWLNPITDPRALRTHFPLAKYAFRIHRDRNGIYYSYLTKYEKDARQGYVAITVMIGSQYESFINGVAIFNLLNLLKTKVLDTENFTAPAVEQCLAECHMPAQNVAPIRVTPLQPTGGQAFRVYSTNDELTDIFQFPKQIEYDKYGDVFLVNKFWCNSSVPGLALLSSPIIKTYNIVKPASVSCDNSIQTGKTLSVTYNKPGFAPLTVPIVINGTNNQYMKYEGATLTILVPDNLPFKQRVNIRVSVNGVNYSDSKVSAAIGNEPLRYSPQTNAYSAEVSQQALSGSDIKLSVNVNDPSLEPYHVSSRRMQKESPLKKWLIPLIAFLVGSLLAGGLTWFLMRDSGDEAVIVEKQQDKQTPDDATTKQNEEDDIKYMKEENTWVLDSLKSDRYKAFFNDIKNGNIDEIVNMAKYLQNLQEDNQKVNGFLISIANALDDAQPDAVKSILAGGDNNTIDLPTILQNIKANSNNGRVEPRDPNPSDTYIPGSRGGNGGNGGPRDVDNRKYQRNDGSGKNRDNGSPDHNKDRKAKPDELL